MGGIIGLVRSGLTLGAGEACNHLCAFLRNVIIARMIGQEDFGIAVTFAMTISLLEMVSNLSTENFLIQSKDGDVPECQSTAHTIELLRGLLLAGAMVVGAIPVADLFGASEKVWVYQLLAIIPLVSGLRHLDMIRLQRKMKYGQFVAAECTANVITAVAAWPLCLLIHDYRVMAYLLITKAVIVMAMSHVLAERRYTLALRGSYLGEAWRFGWPLLLNGLLVFVTFQGDRFIIGTGDRFFGQSHYTLADLAIYSVVFSTAMAPSLIIAGIASRVFLPALSHAREVSADFRRQHMLCAQLLGICGVVMGVPLIVWSEPLLRMLYGDTYAVGGALLAWLAASQAMRVLRVGPTLVALARSDSRSVLIGNIARGTALFGALWAAMNGMSLVMFAVVGLVGEVFALAICTWRLKRLHGDPASTTLWPATIVGIGISSSGVVMGAGISRESWLMVSLFCIGFIVASIGAMLLLFPSVRDQWVLLRGAGTA